MHIDRIYLQQKATQMLKREHSKHKCLVPTQNWLPNAVVEEREGGLNNFRVRKTN